MRLFLGLMIVVLVLAATATPVAAQGEEQRITLTFAPAVAAVGGDTELALSGSAGYRFTEHLSLEGEFTWIDAAGGGIRNQFAEGRGGITSGILTELLPGGSGRSRNNARLPSFNLSNLAPALIRTIGVSELRATVDGETMIGTLGVRYEPSVQTARFRPYISGGLGVNRTEEEFQLRVTATSPTFDDSVAHSGFALSAGGGANIRLFSSLWANVDAKYFRLSRDRNIVRLGGGATFKF